MRRSGLQWSVAGLLGLTACAAVNFWLFRQGLVAGLVGLNLTKHVGVAVICRAVSGDGPGRDRPVTVEEVPG